MQQNTSSIMPKRGHQPDRYEGQLHPTSKLRHGKGQYNYPNSYFTYQGDYENGQKHGKGTLSCKDGRFIEGTFQNDELIGQATVKYPDGAVYKGNLELGQRSGEGSYTSDYQKYEGAWKDNKKNGYGTHVDHSTSKTYSGAFIDDKYEGQGSLQKYNYSYKGYFKRGLKAGQGKQIDDWLRNESKVYGRFQYEGEYKADCFEGQGVFKSRQSPYCYKGLFSKGQPVLFPNELRVFSSTTTRSGEECTQSEKALVGPAIQLQLEGDSLNLYVQSVYQGPEELDEVQPTQEQIQGMIKNWQNENKKNKNPPPMPDFNQPRMKKPDVVLVQQETGRLIELKLQKEAEGSWTAMKIDYRKQMDQKRKENQELRQEALKKAEEDGGKKGGKKDPKGEPQLKVNLFKEQPSCREKSLGVHSQEGTAKILGFELPDDFPPGKYRLDLSSGCSDFAELKGAEIEFTVRAKAAKKK